MAPKAAASAGLVIPQLHPSVPLAYSEGSAGEWLKELVTMGVLTPDSMVHPDPVRAFIEAIEARPEVAFFDGYDALRGRIFELVDGRRCIGLDVWPPANGFDIRIDLSHTVYALIDKGCDPDAILAAVSILNQNPFLGGPRSWGQALDNTRQREDVEELRPEDYEAAWLQADITALEIERHLPEIEAKLPDLGDIYRRLHNTALEFPGETGRQWGVTRWRPGDAVCHGWDAFDEAAANGEFDGDNSMTYSFEARSVEELLKELRLLMEAIKPLEELNTWSWKTNRESTPSRLLSSYMEEHQGQRLLSLATT